MVVIGGITRLTLSGLSITEWQPVTGVVPPLSEAAWMTEFWKYQQIPQYRLLNTGMNLAEFKNIYLWEYVHRLWGRLIGVAYALPLLYFLWRRQLPRSLTGPLVAIFGLGLAQGALGWYMVKSGLADRIDVSQYRLVAHLLLALAIYGMTLWIALGLRRNSPRYPPSPPRGVERVGVRRGIPERSPTPTSPSHTFGVGPSLSPLQGGEGNYSPTGPMWRRLAEAIIALVVLSIAAGGFVAGFKAGLTYNTFPLMDGSFVPVGYAQLEPFIRNWFENIAAVQFDHRLLAMTTAGAIILLWAIAQRATLPRRAQLALHALLAAAVLQFALGVSTLLLVVPIPLAAAHQAGAVLLLSAAIVFRHALHPTVRDEIEENRPILGAPPLPRAIG
jgi:cytochrome c oxidase assembly protein subunit 15